VTAGTATGGTAAGLAAQSTLGNLVAGLSITLYRPFRLGDTLQVTAPTGTEVGASAARPPTSRPCASWRCTSRATCPRAEP
jgi:hypothetical protein